MAAPFYQPHAAALLALPCLHHPYQVYKRVLDKPTSEKRVAGICQRENSFYVDTVRAFRCVRCVRVRARTSAAGVVVCACGGGAQHCGGMIGLLLLPAMLPASDMHCLSFTT